MFSLNISCPVCKAAFKNNDTIYSTQCGHTFHYNCMCKWMRESASCPVCRSYNPATHQVYINFENGSEYESVVQDLKAKLECYENKNKKLDEELGKKVKEKDAVKRLYEISTQFREDLESKLQILEQQNQQQKHEHEKKLTEKLEENEMLKTQIEIMEKDNSVEELNKKCKELITENIKLNISLGESESLNIEAKQKIAMLELRLKYVNMELTKQFDHGFQTTQKAESLKNERVSMPRKRNRTQQENKHRNGKTKEAFNLSTETLDSIKWDGKVCKTPNNRCKVMISDFPKENLVYPLKDTIVLLASKMALTLTHEDILSVHIIQPKHKSKHLNKVYIVIEFSSIERKTQFLQFSNRLNFDPATRTIKVKDYVEKYKLFMYANRKLRAHGYEYIACKDSNVVAKEKLCDTEEIVIRDENHVDALVRSLNMSVKPASSLFSLLHI